jgi:hypothetical protein
MKQSPWGKFKQELTDEIENICLDTIELDQLNTGELVKHSIIINQLNEELTNDY